MPRPASTEGGIMRSLRTSGTRAVLGGGLLLLAGAAPVLAQAWLPPKGEASLTLGYAHMWANEHINQLGQPTTPGDMIWNAVGLDLSYSVTNRFAVRVSVPYVISKYDGAFPHPKIAGHVAFDDGKWHGTFQDLTTEVRFRIPAGSFAITPFAGLAVPTCDYPSYGHSAPGSQLTVGRFGVTAGRLLDPLLPDAYFQVRYTYSVPEKPLGISHNSSNLAVDLGYLVGPALTLRVLGSWQKTYGGWNGPIDWPARTDPAFLAHDQLNRTDFFRLGGSAAYA